MSTEYPETTIQVQRGKTVRPRILNHIPPTAFPVRWRDLLAGLFASKASVHAHEEFCKLISKQVGSRETFLVNSGRSALTLILKSLRRDGDSNKVLIPAYSCSTVLQSVLEAGLKPEFCDVSLDTLDFNRTNLMNMLAEKPLAVVGVHLYGLAQDFSEAISFSKEQGIVFIEDAAQAFGAKIEDQMVGMQGDIGLFSLGSGKCLPVGGGGVIVASAPISTNLERTFMDEFLGSIPTGRRSIAKLLAYMLAVNPLGWWIVNHTRLNPSAAGADFQELPEITFSYLSEMQSGIGLSLLERAEENYREWRKNAEKLTKRLQEFEFLKLPAVPSNAQPVFLRLPIVVDSLDRTDRLFNLLEKAGIGVSRSYRFTLPGLYSKAASKNGSKYPAADHLTKCLLTLPTNVYLDDRAIDRIYTIFNTEH